MSNDLNNDQKNGDEKERQIQMELPDYLSHRKFIQTRLRRNLLASAIYELIIAMLFIVIPYLLVNDLQIDVLYSLTLQTVLIFYAIGYTLVAFIIVQILFGILISMIDGTKIGKIWGYIVGIFMLIIPPTGTFFGIILLQDLKNPDITHSKNNSEKIGDIKDMDGMEDMNNLNNKDEDRFHSNRERFLDITAKNIIVSGIIMLNIPIILLLLNLWMITQQFDILYPTISTKIIEGVETFGWVYFGIYGAQIMTGFFFKHYWNGLGMKLLIILFGMFQILSIGIPIQVYFWTTGYTFGLSLGLAIFLYGFGWIFGVLINPLGIYFGSMLLRVLKSQKDQKNHRNSVKIHDQYSKQ